MERPPNFLARHPTLRAILDFSVYLVVTYIVLSYSLYYGVFIPEGHPFINSVVVPLSCSLLMASLFKTWWTQPGFVPEGWFASCHGTLAKKERETVERQYDFCGICSNHKPLRSHHCSRCDRCVLKMDHHCPWLNNCIGYKNYKSFLLTLIYGSLSTFLPLYTLFPRYCVSFLTLFTSFQFDNLGFDIYYLTLFLVCATLMYLLLFHCIFLITSNLTTIEYYEKHREEEFENHNDVGYKQNILQVFGANPLLWPFPVFHPLAEQDVQPFCFPLKDKTS
eukprot:TRINITY_DN1445_c0_g1_i2.p1 TRINITY_DN1445_c0_g1~~TRINITY_DN1445_c0_g1_i2.p1  ORF type:complete len:278 (-),score=17.01 TRINITY_DN1445_c0_g1_i2:127-960(-)